MSSKTLSACAEIVKKGDEDRYLAALFAPDEVREDLFVLYAFNHEVAKIREVVSESLLGEIRLQWWREAIEGIFDGTPRTHEVVTPLNEVINKYKLPRDLFEALLDARAQDLYEDPFQNSDELKSYVMATSVGLFELASLIVCPHEQLADIKDILIKVGFAWAAIGLIRSVPFKATHRWCFIPKDREPKFEINIEKVFAGKSDEGLSKALAPIVADVEVALDELRDLRKYVPDTLWPAILPATLCVPYIKKIKKAAYDPFASDLNLSLLRKQTQLLRATVLGRL